MFQASPVQSSSSIFLLTCEYIYIDHSYNVNRALLHFLDPEKFRNKDVFVQNYKNLSSFNENEVQNSVPISCTFIEKLCLSCILIAIFIHFIWAACESPYGIKAPHITQSNKGC